MVFYRSLSDSKSPHVSRTFLSILVVLNNEVVWMVSILPLISNSSSLFFLLLGTVPSASTIIGIIITLMFHGFFQVFVYLFTFFYFRSVVLCNGKIIFFSGLLAGSR